MGKIWEFARQPLNLALLIALGGVVGFLWNRFSPQLNVPTPAQAVQTQIGPSAKAARGNAIAAGADAQVAKAEPGGTAVNVRDQAQVDIRK